MDLEFIIGLKAGIGHTVAEAENAMQTAKALKENILTTDNFLDARRKVVENVRSGNFPLHLYSGPAQAGTDVLVEAKEEVERRVRNSITRLGNIKIEYGEHSSAYLALLDEVNSQVTDPHTGALVPFGYVYKLITEQEERIKNLKPGEEKYVALIDANNMHEWNALVGYDAVTAHLNAIGQALVHAGRSGMKKTQSGKGDESRAESEKRERPLDLVLHSSKVTRTHGSAGDEFIIELYCPRDKIEGVVGRLFSAAYQAQNNLYPAERRLRI